MRSERASLSKYVTTFFGIIIISLLCITKAYGDLSLNFTPQDPHFGKKLIVSTTSGERLELDRGDARCNRPEGHNPGGCNGPHSNSQYSPPDMTPFLQEANVVIDGITYFHILLGTPDSGFSQEVFIRRGFHRHLKKAEYYSASLGRGDCWYQVGASSGFNSSRCNMSNQLSDDHVFTGNGSGDPTKVLIRQTLGGAWDSESQQWHCQPNDEFCSEFLKDSFTQKPKIQQTNRDFNQGLEAYFAFDMSNSDYSTLDIVGEMTNTVLLASVGASASFDYAEDAHISHVNGGKYTFTPTTPEWGDAIKAECLFPTVYCTGPTYANENPYFYEEGNFNLDLDWSIYDTGRQYEYDGMHSPNR